MEIEPIDVARLDVPTRLPDLRRDLHVFVEYVRDREVKRSHRGNSLSKADAKRLAKLMSDADAAEEVDETGSSAWVDFVDDVALKLGFVHYDTEGDIRRLHQPGAVVSGQLHRVPGKALRAVPRGEGRPAGNDAPGIAAQGSSGRRQRVLSDGRVGAAGRVQPLGIGDRRHAHARFRGHPPLLAGALGGVPRRPMAERGLAGRAPEEEPSLFPHSQETCFKNKWEAE